MLAIFSLFSFDGALVLFTRCFMLSAAVCAIFMGFTNELNGAMSLSCPSPRLSQKSFDLQKSYASNCWPSRG